MAKYTINKFKNQNGGVGENICNLYYKSLTCGIYIFLQINKDKTKNQQQNKKGLCNRQFIKDEMEMANKLIKKASISQGNIRERLLIFSPEMSRN